MRPLILESRSGVSRCGALLGFALCAGSVAAQSVLAPSPEFSVTPPSLQQLQQSEMEVFPPPGAVQLPQTQPFRLGQVTARPHIFYRFMNADGLPTEGSNHVSSIVQEIAPGILLNLGSHWSLDYTPTLRYYSNRAFNDTLDHNVRFAGGTEFDDWILGLTQSYETSTTPLAETGTQTSQETFLTGLTGSRRLNSKMSLDLAASQSIVSAEGFTGNNEWSTTDWLNYEFLSRLNAGGGIAVGYVDVSSGSDMTYQQFLGRLGWRATDVLSVRLHGGIEVREFLSGGQGTLVNPVMDATIQYQPTEVTRFSIRADRTVTPSYFADQVIEDAGLTADLNQRLLKVLFLDLSGGFHRSKYVGSSGTSGRSDDYYTFNANLSTAFLKQRGTAAVFYQFADDISSVPGFSFTSHQVGFELGYRY